MENMQPNQNLSFLVVENSFYFFSKQRQADLHQPDLPFARQACIPLSRF